ncbi:MAG: site-specific DNA-methyltransferase, partial [Deltaproteobacteria bacterium]|nr:site-specific DNA-methyltransferase [Deltaproteobacteria bacterium]
MQTTRLELLHRFHPFCARFPSHIVEEALASYTKPGDSVFDPFCGSGTTLVEALALGRNAVGVDANPLACLISQAKTTRLGPGDTDCLHGLIRRARDFGNALTREPGAPFVSAGPRPRD